MVAAITEGDQAAAQRAAGAIGPGRPAALASSPPSERLWPVDLDRRACRRSGGSRQASPEYADHLHPAAAGVLWQHGELSRSPANARHAGAFGIRIGVDVIAPSGWPRA
jgi:hypothetical protein